MAAHTYFAEITSLDRDRCRPLRRGGGREAGTVV